VLAPHEIESYYTDMCSYCGSPIVSDRKPGFNEVCESCGKDLHVCLNCRFYKPGARYDCAETIEEQVSDKERRNHCDWYQTNPVFFTKTEGRNQARSAAAKARSDLDKLFGG